MDDTLCKISWFHENIGVRNVVRAHEKIHSNTSTSKRLRYPPKCLRVLVLDIGNSDIEQCMYRFQRSKTSSTTGGVEKLSSSKENIKYVFRVFFLF